MEIFKLFGRIMVDDKEAQNSLSKTDKKTKSLGDRLMGGIKTFAKWGVALTGAAVAVSGSLFALTNKATQTADAIAKGAIKMGTSTDFYQEMDYWAGQNGISHENMTKAVERFNQRIGAAQNGNEKYAGALNKLGVSMDDIRDGTLSTEDAFAQSIQTLSEMENQHDQVALATDMFGTKLARNLLPALQDGSLSMDEAREKAHELGLVISEDQLAASEQFQDSWDDIKQSLGMAVTQIGLDLMPMFQTMMDWILTHMPTIQNVFKFVFEVIGDVINVAVEWIQKLISMLSEWFSASEGTLTKVWEIFQTYLGLLIDYWTEIFERIRAVLEEVLGFVISFIKDTLLAIYSFWKENGEQILENVITIFNSIWETIEFVMTTVWNLIKDVLDMIVPFIQEQLEKIFAFWDQHGEMIMNAVQNVFNFIKSIIDFVMPYILTIIEYIWNQISTIFETALGVIMGIIQFFAALFTGDWKAMGDALLSIWNSIWGGIKGVVENAWNFLSGAFKSLWNSISSWFTSIVDFAKNWGRNMIQGFIDGIMGMVNKVKDAVGGVMNSVKGFLGFNSPAEEGEGRHIVEWGSNMIDGFLDGAEEEKSNAGKVMNDILSEMDPDHLEGIESTNVMNKKEFTEQKDGAKVIFDRGAFDGLIIMDDYSVNRLMDQIIDILSRKGVTV